MKKISILTTPFLLVVFALLFFLTSKTKAQTINCSNSLNNYSFNLYHNTKVENENLFLSPLSTYYALLMAYEGSKNKTKQEFEKVLYLNNSDALNNNYIYNIANKLDNCSGLKISNAIWLDKNFVVEDKYRKSVSDKYFSDLKQTDFTNREAAALDINGWIAEKTNSRINKIISESDINAATKLLISNVVYFKGEWLIKFNKQKKNSQ